MADGLRKDADKLTVSDVAARLKRYCGTTGDSKNLGVILQPCEFTKFFVDKPRPDFDIPQEKFSLLKEMQGIYRQAIREAQTGKAADPDKMPIELLQICPEEMAELLFELFAASARLECVVKGLDESIIISIYKKRTMRSIKLSSVKVDFDHLKGL